MDSPFWKQAWAVSAVLVNMFGQGLVLTYPSVLLPGLNATDSPIKVDLHGASWLGSIVGLTGIPASLVASILMDIYGRRITHWFAIFPGMVGWLIIFFAKDVKALLMGRMTCGISAAASVHLGAIIIGEYTCPRHRGVYLCLKSTVVCLAGLFNHIVGHFLHWKTVAMMALIPNVIAICITYTWPESPAWLASKQMYGDSERAFYWLRGHSEDSTLELRKMIHAQMDKASVKEPEITLGRKTLDFLKKLTRRDFLKPISVVLVATIILEVSGRHIFPAYALEIIGSLTGEKVHAFYYTLAIDVIITSSTIVSSALVKVINRRTLLFLTGFSAYAVLMVICLYLLLSNKGVIPNDKPWIPIGLFVLYFILANLGCVPIPLALVGEVFPVAHRGAGSAIAGIWISVCLTAGLKSSPHLISSINVYGAFFVYGTVMALCLLILYFIMPETKDKTLQEIEDYYNSFEHKPIKDDDDDEVVVKMIDRT